jgi:hypothetical protein
MLLGALAAQRIGWRHSMRDRRARRRTKIRRLAYRLGLAENQCTGNLTVASDFLVPIAVKRGSKFVGSCAAGAGLQKFKLIARHLSSMYVANRRLYSLDFK